MKQIAHSFTSLKTSCVDTSPIPSVSGNTILHRPQSITTWLIDNQSIPNITSNPSRGKQTRFTLNRLPYTSIEHPTQAKFVETCPDASVETINLHPKSQVDNPSFFTQSWDMNECEALESNNTSSLLSNNKQ